MSIEIVVATISVRFSLVVAGAAIAGFLWTLHRDMGKLAERVAHVEGLLKGWRDSVREAVREAIDDHDRRGAESGD